MHSDPKLRRWYLKFNADFFGGELPDDVEVYWAPGGTDAGRTFQIAPPMDGNPAQLAITIDPCFMGIPRHAKIILAHEMCHVKLWPRGERLTHHGTTFDEEIQRLTTFRAYRKLL